MAGMIQCGRRTRRDFGKIPSIVEIPNLIEVQKGSYEAFLQKDVAPERREDVGLQAVFKSVFPITDYNENASLEFVNYHFGDPKYSVEECHDRGMTFAIPLKLTLRLVVYEQDKEAKTRAVRAGKLLYSARVIPYRGSWLEFDFDANDVLHVRVDRRRKMSATAFLRAFWFLERGCPKPQDILSDEEILPLFYDLEEVLALEGGVAWKRLHPEVHVDEKVAEDIRPPRHREPVVQAGKKLTRKIIEQLRELQVARTPVRAEELEGRRTGSRVVDQETGEVLLDVNQEIKADHLRTFAAPRGGGAARPRPRA